MAPQSDNRAETAALSTVFVMRRTFESTVAMTAQYLGFAEGNARRQKGTRHAKMLHYNKRNQLAITQRCCTYALMYKLGFGGRIIFLSRTNESSAQHITLTGGGRETV